MDGNSLTITPAEFDENIQRTLNEFEVLQEVQKTRSPSPESPTGIQSPAKTLPGTPLGLEPEASTVSLLDVHSERERELLQDFDLQMALALSLSESEAKAIRPDAW